MPWYPVRPRRTIPAPLEEGYFYSKTVPPAAEKAGCFEEAPRLAGAKRLGSGRCDGVQAVRLFPHAPEEQRQGV